MPMLLGMMMTAHMLNSCRTSGRCEYIEYNYNHCLLWRFVEKLIAGPVNCESSKILIIMRKDMDIVLLSPKRSWWHHFRRKCMNYLQFNSLGKKFISNALDISLATVYIDKKERLISQTVIFKWDCQSCNIIYL